MTMKLLKNVNVIPMVEERVLKSKDLLIENMKIARVGDNLDITDIKTIDCTNKYLIPGLFDMHTHFASSDMFNLFLANGITSVRNMWGTQRVLEWKDDVESGKRIGPNIYSTTPLMDGIKRRGESHIVKTPEDAEKAVLKAKCKGYKLIKTYPDIPREAFITLMKTAKKEGLEVVGHSNKNVTTDELINLGYYSIEHASILPNNKEEVIKIAKSGMWFCPTLVIVWAIHHYGIEEKDITKIQNYKYVNEQQRKEWAGITDVMSRSLNVNNYNIEEILRLAKVFVNNSDNVLLGTDNSNPGVVTGFSIHDELELLIRDLGFTPYGAIRTGTVNAARNLGILDRTGTIQEGKDADLVLLDGNPLEDISNTKRISAVIKSGDVYDRAALDGMLQSVLNTP